MSHDTWDDGSTGDAELWELLARHVAGECDDAEADHVRRWLAEDPARAELLSSLDVALQHLPSVRAAPAIDVEAALVRVRARCLEAAEDDESPAAAGAQRASPEFAGSRAGASSAVGAPADARPDAQESVRPIPNARFRRPERRFGWPTITLLRAAAAVIVLVGGALLWRQMQSSTAPAGTDFAASYLTGFGQLDSLSLPDGTAVVLAPGSVLDVPAGYGGEARVVTLQGKAFFDVADDDARPFTVMAAGRVVRDLGTAFTVRAGDDGAVEVVVTEGTVMLASAATASDGARLAAGDRGTINAAGQTAVQRGGASAADTAWTRGRLVFEDTPIHRVAEELRRWYGTRLTWDDPAVAERRITAAFEGETEEEVLEVIGIALGAGIERRDDVAVIRLDGAAAP